MKYTIIRFIGVLLFFYWIFTGRQNILSTSLNPIGQALNFPLADLANIAFVVFIFYLISRRDKSEDKENSK